MANEYLKNSVFESIINKFQDAKRVRTRLELLVEDVQDAFERKSKRNANVDEDVAYLKELSSLYSVAIGNHQMCQKELATAFYTLSENIVRYAKFNLIDADDAIQEGVLICFENIDRFDPSKGKAFNYMTTCILNNFRQLYRSARNYNELKKKYQRFMNDINPPVCQKSIKQGNSY